MNDIDRPWMLRALDLAERGRGYVEPNPLVGAVIVRDGQVVGEGWHQRFGEAHAEIHALNAAGEAARGATLFITLEPCCHQGKTPPCTAAIIHAGIKRVVAAMPDPFPQVAGQGTAQLQGAGIPVDIGLCESEARRLNNPYLTLLTAGRPYVHAKWAMTLDGKICTRTGDSKWISNEAARRRVHELRGRMDAIIVGIGTVLADDPLLTARPSGPRIATRVILDSEGRLPSSTRLTQTAKASPVLVVTADNVPDTDPLRQVGCEVLTLGGQLGRPAVGELLSALGKRRMTNVLVEGGSEVLGSFFDAGVVDEVWVIVAPTIIGGAGKSPVAGVGVEQMTGAWGLTNWTVETVENNVLMHGLCRR
ncbi:MAG TPA: bifunctional diaminohydroxyphosphoribosylaminopyrimidine deaminase/5-amino-6-(5-phosphoribosylamino)uracil reductase RibD [Gemmataceae bacterium]|nr:bifunctional diaminohydroxyphosphoribosylaminopyrimidine deaminase/5-amino-6-(5-phosphoribosylamino)uracil reductase RibD [Gemmataceae bacterium]